MVIYFQYTITRDVLPLLLLVAFVSIRITKAASTVSFLNDDNMRRADEYVMTSALVNGLKRSNVCGDGYRIEGAVLKSYPYSKLESYLPYEDCSMTFKARRPDNQIRIRILSLDLNDIHGGVNCLDSLRFYKSAYVTRKEKLNTVECGQLTEEQGFSVISPTGIVTAHFSTDGGNVNGLGFKAVLTAFRYPNKTHPCDMNNEEFHCTSRECISSLLVCDGVSHCLDGSDESANRSCASGVPESLNSADMKSNNLSETTRRPHWRSFLIATFLFIIFIAFTIFMAYFVCRRYVRPPMSLINGERKNYAAILSSPINGPKTTTTTQVVTGKRKQLDDDYNLL